MASPEELLEQIRQKSQQPNDLGFTGGQLGMGAGQGVLPETENPFAVQTGVTPQAPVVGPTIASEPQAPAPVAPAPVNQKKPGFFKPGGFGYEYLGGRLGENLGEFAGKQKYGTGITAEGKATGFPVDRPSLAGDLLTLPGTALNVAGDFIVDPLVAGGSMAKDFANYATGATGVQAQQQAAQAATEASASAAPAVGVAKPPQASYTPPAMDGSQIPKIGEDGFRFAERGSPQDFFLAQTNDGTTQLSQEQIARGQAFARQQGMNFEPTTGFSQGTQAPEPQVGFTPQATTFQGTDFQGRLRQFDSPEAQQANIAEGQASFAQASADREARQAARPDFGTAISDRDRRAASGEDISTADRRDMAKANMRGASASDIARGNKIADELGVDLKTGKPVGGLTPEQDLAERKFQAEQASKGNLSVADTIALSKEERAIRGEETEAKKAATEVSEGRKRDFSAAEALFAGTQNIAEVGQTAQRQAGKAGTTGIAGAIFAKLKPGSTAADMRANLDTLTADAAFGALQTMRDNSKTGGALGAISERELSLLGAAQRSLAASQSPEQLQENIRAYLKLRSESMARVKAGFAQEYGIEEANRIFGGGESKGSTSSVKNDQNVAGNADSLLGKY